MGFADNPPLCPDDRGVHSVWLPFACLASNSMDQQARGVVANFLGVPGVPVYLSRVPVLENVLVPVPVPGNSYYPRTDSGN